MLGRTFQENTFADDITGVCIPVCTTDGNRVALPIACFPQQHFRWKKEQTIIQWAEPFPNGIGIVCSSSQKKSRPAVIISHEWQLPISYSPHVNAQVSFLFFIGHIYFPQSRRSLGCASWQFSYYSSPPPALYCTLSVYLYLHVAALAISLVLKWSKSSFMRSQLSTLTQGSAIHDVIVGRAGSHIVSISPAMEPPPIDSSPHQVQQGNGQDNQIFIPFRFLKCILLGPDYGIFNAFLLCNRTSLFPRKQMHFYGTAHILNH